MKVAAVVVLYGGLLDSVQVFSNTDKARKRYEELLKEHNLDENGRGDSEYDVTLEKDLLVY